MTALNKIPTVLVGTGFRGAGAKTAVAMMRAGDEVALEREPANPHDRLAIGCHYLGRHVGYIPRQANPRIAAALDAGHAVTCTVAEPPLVQNGVIRKEPKLTVSWEEIRVNNADVLREAERLVRYIGALLHDKDREVQTVVLVELTAIWLGRHRADNPESTLTLRAEILSLHCAAVRKLVDLADEETP